jgi:hypothetical protein
MGQFAGFCPMFGAFLSITERRVVGLHPNDPSPEGSSGTFGAGLAPRAILRYDPFLA